MMATFRRKPTVVEAEQFHLGRRLPRGVQVCGGSGRRHYVMTIHNSIVFITDGDWIVAEQDGLHFYPVKPAIFESTYEPVEDAP